MDKGFRIYIAHEVDYALLGNDAEGGQVRIFLVYQVGFAQPWNHAKDTRTSL
jgi:hypothetical protein